MQIISWNLNGLTSCVKNGSFKPIDDILPDAICCQEIRTKDQPVVIDGYHHFFNPAEEDKYSGTLLLTIEEPLDVQFGLGIEDFDREGRIITADMCDFYLVNTYVPNSQRNLERHYYRLDWDEAFREHMTGLVGKKPVIACGDFNVTLLPIDVFPENERQNAKEQEYASDERANMQILLEQGFVDAFRYLYPDAEHSYTWWSNRLNKRRENRGWRLDYFIVSEGLTERISDVIHHTDIYGSDHCPIELILR